MCKLYAFKGFLQLRHLARSIPTAIGGCVILGGVMGTYDLVGAMIGNKPDEEKRKRFFKDPQNAVAN